MTAKPMKNPEPELIGMGIPGLDDILQGGITPHRVYLVEGNPGAGKTTLALQFLVEGVRQGEIGIFVTLSETREELLAVAASHGWSLEGIQVVELVAAESELDPDNQFTMFQPSEMELNLTTKAILSEVDKLKPARVVIDSLSEMRLLAHNSLRYRRQILALKQFFIGRQCTVLFLDDNTAGLEDLQVRSIAHGVITLEQLSPEYGADRRRLRVAKLRGQKYRGGYHDFVIERGGLGVFPRLVASEHTGTGGDGRLESGVKEFDTLLGGGIDFGTSILFIGPAGSGKSSLAIQYMKAAAARGERSAFFSFDERISTLLKRSAGLGLDLSQAIESDHVRLRQIDSAELSPGEFAHTVRAAVDGADGQETARIIVIDSLNGYLAAMPEERFLIAQLHELFTYLGNKGVVTFLIMAQHGILGSHMTAPIDTTYLADSVVLFRFFEARGQVRRAVSVVKKRTGAHELTIREFSMGADGLRVGQPLADFHGVLSGIPQLLSRDRPSARNEHA
jgi:circadian clock protein KaiC